MELFFKFFHSLKAVNHRKLSSLRRRVPPLNFFNRFFGSQKSLKFLAHAPLVGVYLTDGGRKYSVVKPLWASLMKTYFSQLRVRVSSQTSFTAKQTVFSLSYNSLHPVLPYSKIVYRKLLQSNLDYLDFDYPDSPL